MKKLLTILLLIMLIISLLQIANMYALYKQENQGVIQIYWEYGQ